MDSVANCQPSILPFSPIWKSGHLEPFGEWNHNLSRHVLFLEKFKKTKIGDLPALSALPEIWKIWSTEILSSFAWLFSAYLIATATLHELFCKPLQFTKISKN